MISSGHLNTVWREKAKNRGKRRTKKIVDLGKGGRGLEKHINSRPESVPRGAKKHTSTLLLSIDFKLPSTRSQPHLL
jgi:hypothetical protein